MSVRARKLPVAPEAHNGDPGVHVLVVDDDDGTRFSIADFLGSRGYRTSEAADCRRARELFVSHQFDAVILDYSLPDGTALDLLPNYKSLDPDIPVLVLTAHGSIDLAVTAVKQGAEQFLTKPTELPTLELLLQRAVEHRRSRQRALAGASHYQREAFDPFVGSSRVIRALFRTCQRLKNASTPVLIYGETGAGKGILARWLHENGARKHEAFVDLNCAGFSHDLLESELFGHEKGAFTGAHSAKPGLLEMGNRGTVFLDEIGDLPLSIQPKLLKVLEEQQFRRLGGLQPRRVNVRLIAATHRDLPELVRAQKFRDDLFFRVNIFPITVPPLRERLEDIPVLAEQLLASCAAQCGRGAIRLSREAVEVMRAYSWPGNIRELRNVLERALLLNDSGVLDRNDLPFAFANQQPVDARLSLSAAEKLHIEKVLRATGGHIPRAARLLGIGKTTLYRKIEDYRIERSKFGIEFPS